MPKKIVRDVVKQAKQLSGEVLKEGLKQPGEMARTAGEQVGVLPEKKAQEPGVQASARVLQEKRKDKERKLVFWRKRQRELARPKRPEPEGASEEEIKKQKKLIKEAEKERPLPETPGKRPRLLGAKRKREKAQPETVGRRHSG